MKIDGLCPFLFFPQLWIGPSGTSLALGKVRPCGLGAKQGVAVLKKL